MEIKWYAPIRNHRKNDLLRICKYRSFNQWWNSRIEYEDPWALCMVSKTNISILRSTNSDSSTDLRGSNDPLEGNEQDVRLFGENPTNEHQKHKRWLVSTPSSNSLPHASSAGHRANAFPCKMFHRQSACGKTESTQFPGCEETPKENLHPIDGGEIGSFR